MFNLCYPRIGCHWVLNTPPHVIYGEREERCLLPREHLGLQGLPVYCYEHKYFAMSSLKWLLGSRNRRHLRKLQQFEGYDASLEAAETTFSESSLRAMAGNMMNMQQVGCVMLWALFLFDSKKIASMIFLRHAFDLFVIFS